MKYRLCLCRRSKAFKTNQFGLRQGLNFFWARLYDNDVRKLNPRVCPSLKIISDGLRCQISMTFTPLFYLKSKLDNSRDLAGIVSTLPSAYKLHKSNMLFFHLSSLRVALISSLCMPASLDAGVNLAPLYDNILMERICFILKIYRQMIFISSLLSIRFASSLVTHIKGGEWSQCIFLTRELIRWWWLWFISNWFKLKGAFCWKVWDRTEIKDALYFFKFSHKKKSLFQVSIAKKIIDLQFFVKNNFETEKTLS